MASIAKKIWKYITDGDYRFCVLAARGFYKNMDDESYLKKLFQIKIGYPLDLENPKTFNEKLQWLKLHDRNPLYTTLVDKYNVREFVADTIGEEYLIPLLGKWDDPDEIDFDALPNQFVLKCNHDSGGLVICQDKSKLDVSKAKAKLNKSLKRNFYYPAREWPYKNVKPCVIAEKYMQGSNDLYLTDYKFMYFHGKLEYVFTCTDRDTGLKVTFFDKEWNKQNFERHYPMSQKKIERPRNFRKMIQLGEKLAAGIPFVRVDFYEVNDQIYFGELTLYPGAGFEEFRPVEYDRRLGDLIHFS